MNETNQLSDMLNKCLENTSSDLGVSASYLASQAITKLDPEQKAPYVVQWGCVLQLRQIARGILRKEYEPVNDAGEPQAEMFEKLQQRYPVARGEEEKKEGEYMPRLLLTLEERQMISEKLRKASKALAIHANALDAETAELIAQGFFDDQHKG